MLWTSVVTLTWSRNHDFFPSWFWLNSASGYIHLMGSSPQFFRNFVGHFSSRFFDCAINLPLKANSQFQWHFAVLQNEALLFRLVLEFQKTASGNIYIALKKSSIVDFVINQFSKKLRICPLFQFLMRRLVVQTPISQNCSALLRPSRVSLRLMCSL